MTGTIFPRVLTRFELGKQNESVRCNIWAMRVGVLHCSSFFLMSVLVMCLNITVE